MDGYRVTADVLNIRSGPGVQYEDIGDLIRDELVGEVDCGWLCIELDDGTQGWVSKKYVEAIGEVVFDEVAVVPRSVTGQDIVNKAMTQNKDPYIFGYEVDLNDPNPKAFDCSELVEWTCGQLDIVPMMPDGAINQYNFCKKYQTLISVEQAVKTAGALLFRISASGNHVVISRGDGSTIEARGSAYGVGVFSTARRTWTSGALIPSVRYTG